MLLPSTSQLNVNYIWRVGCVKFLEVVTRFSGTQTTHNISLLQRWHGLQGPQNTRTLVVGVWNTSGYNENVGRRASQTSWLVYHSHSQKVLIPSVHCHDLVFTNDCYQPFIKKPLLFAKVDFGRSKIHLTNRVLKRPKRAMGGQPLSGCHVDRLASMVFTIQGEIRNSDLHYTVACSERQETSTV